MVVNMIVYFILNILILIRATINKELGKSAISSEFVFSAWQCHIEYPQFASPYAKVERTVVWVCFPGLNLVYYDESFLLAMTSIIGRPIKVDTNTLKVERESLQGFASRLILQYQSWEKFG